MTKNILIVDDEADLCEILKFNLEHENYAVDTAGSAEEALTLLQKRAYHLILLDIMMGGMSGFKMVELLKKEWKNDTPVIFLTARDTENDMLTGFSVGADDYISKPFSIKDIKAVIKRFQQAPKINRQLIFNNVVIDFETKELMIDEKKITLTKTEFEILVLLAENPERMFSREHILERVWKDTPYIVERTVDVHITRLRKKLGKHSSLIINRPGYGYRFNHS
jgi:DNA-binding response OmpR family regulator